MSDLSNFNNIDLYFVIAKFLAAGPCKKAFEVLVNEVQEHGLIPERVDWTGERHERTYEEFESLHPTVSSEHLGLLLSQLRSSVDKLYPIPHLTPLHPSLLSTSKLSLLRNAISSPTVYPTIQRVIGSLKWGAHDPPRRLVHPPNLTTLLAARSLTGHLNKRHVFRDELYSSRLQLHKRTVGHLSSVYCVLFDRTGRYIVTGSDDTLVKLWSVRDGRLLATLRGAAGEISDIAVDPENTMVAAGCCDKTIRVWNLQTLSPIAVLISHTGMITAVQFCPSPDTEDGEGLLVSTGGDGCVAFWTYTRAKGSITFRRKPLKFNERVRPGHAQLICCSFSAGGTMLALGGVDHHVRVYRFGGCEGLEKMIERAEHSDCVDSIQWCHEGLAFASGSRDGSALIWRYQRQAWHTTKLDMAISTPGSSAAAGPAGAAHSAPRLYSGYRPAPAAASSEQKKVLVTMVGWSLEDQYVVTCSSDHHVRVWDSITGRLVRLLTGHTDDAFVVEAHPTNVNLVLTAGHDGQLMIWNVRSGALVCSFKNAIEGQGHGALFDAKWSPDGLHIAATDSHGHICLYGMGTNELCNKVPQELFFHTDYRPLVRDTHQYVLDEQTQLAPHLMPPPFLVNIDGNPYPPALQRLVPGRETCDDTMLVPNVIFNANGDREVFEVADLSALHAFLNQMGGDMRLDTDDDYDEEPPPLPAPPLPPPPPPRPEPSPRLVPRPSDSPGFMSPDSVVTDDRPRLVDQMIERLVREQQEQINLSFGSGDGGSGSEEQQLNSSFSAAPLVSPRPASSSNFAFSLPGSTSSEVRVPPPRLSPLVASRPSAPSGAPNGPAHSNENGPSASRSLLATERRLSAPIGGEPTNDRRLSSSSMSNHNLPGPSGVNSVRERRPSQLEALQERDRSASGGEHSYAAAMPSSVPPPVPNRGSVRSIGDVEGVRHSTGNWQRQSHEVKFGPRRVLVRALSPSTLCISRERRQCRADQEEESYLREASKEPFLVNADGNGRSLNDRDEDISPRSARQRRQQQRRQQQQLENSSNSGSRVRSSNSSPVRGQRSNRGTRGSNARVRNGNEDGTSNRGAEGGSSYATRGNREVGRGRYSHDYEDPNAVASHESSHSDDDSGDSSSSESSSSGESTDYSDWTAEQGINLEPPKRTAHRQKKSPSSRSKRRQARNAVASDDDEDDDGQLNTSGEQQQQKRISKREKKKNPRYLEEDKALGHRSGSSDREGPSSQLSPPARQRREVRGRLNNLNESSDSEPGEIPEAFRPPEWLTETQPKRAPYFPQMGDELMYFMQGHMSYVDAVIKRKLYNIEMKSLPWTKPNSNIKECEYVKIIGIKYEIRPPRLCCLKLAILNPNTNRISTDTFTLKYHDIPDVLDFLVLKQMHDTSAARNWQVGDRFRCIIDDAWWLGTVTRREAPGRECPESLFMCYFVTWDNGETEKLSPWDMEPIGDVAEAHESGAGIVVSPEELERLRYKWTDEDWPDGRDGGDEGSRIATGIGLVMGLSVAEPFLAPVDLSVYPNYAMIVEYPMDLSTIKSRLENGFYRRLNAVQFDVRYIATNAEKFNQRGSNIVRQARIVTELCLDLIKNPACRDPTARYHEIASTYHSPNASDLDAPGPSGASTSAGVNGSRRGRRGPKATAQSWEQQCREVLRAVFERGDSVPFRHPVDLEQYPDYNHVVEVPMDLTTVREELATQAYESPHQFAADVRLIFCNSKSYNTNKKSKIYSMTVRLEAFFEDKMKSVFASYQAQEKAAKKSSKRGSKSGMSSQRRKPSPNPAKPSTSTEARPLSAAGSSRGQTLRSTVGTGRGTSLLGLTNTSTVRLRRLTNPYGPYPTTSSLQNGIGEDSNEEEERGRLAPVEDDEDSPTGDDSFGTRRSKRVAKLKRCLSSDDSDEDYSPVKKRALEGSARGRRKLGGAARSNMPETSGVGVRPRITVQYQEDSDSEQEEYVAPSSLISTPRNNFSPDAGNSNGASKRVVLKLSFPQESDQANVEAAAASDTGSTDNSGGGEDVLENIPSSNFNSADSGSNKSVKRKLAIDSSDDHGENDEDETDGSSSADDGTGESLNNKGVEEPNNGISVRNANDSESSDSISNRPKKKRRRLADKKPTKSISSASSDSLQEDEGQRSESPRRNGGFVNKKKIIPNIGRKMPIYKGSLVPGSNKKKRKEDSEFECDDNDFQSSDYSEEEVDKSKKGIKKKKVPPVRKSRRTVLDGDDDLGDEDFVVDDDNIDGRRESDESNSSSSSSSSPSGSSSDDAGHSEESDELMSSSRKGSQHKHSKGIVKSSATLGKKIPLKYKPEKSSKKHRGSGSKPSPGTRGGLRGRRKGTSGTVKRRKPWVDEEDDLPDYKSGEEVMDGEQVIGKVFYNSDDETSDDYSPSVKKKRGGRGGRRGASRGGFKRAIDAYNEEEVRKSSRRQRKVRYDEADDDDDYDDLNVSSRGRVRRANTLMKDFI